MTDYVLNNEFSNAFKTKALGLSIGEHDQLAAFAKILRSGTQMAEIDLASMYGLGGERGTSAEGLGKTERQAIANLARTNDVDLSVHAPWAINFAGIDPNSGKRDPDYKRLSTHEANEAIKFADDIGATMGRKNMPVIFHAAFDQFGNPDKNARIVAYDNNENKVMAVGPEKFSNMNIAKFKDIYGEDTYNRLKSGIKEVDGAVELSPQAAFDFKKDQSRMQASQEIANLEITKRNLEYNNRALAAELAVAAAKGDRSKVEELTKRSEAFSQMTEDLERRRKILELETQNLDKRFTTFEQKAPKLAAEGIKDAALFSYERTKTKPMILVENTMTPDMSLSNPAETAAAVKEARALLVKELQKRDGLSRSSAEEISEQMIGINLDVGHLNIFKSYTNPKTGKPYTDREIIEMAKSTKDYLKRYHLNDNMGHVDAHLPLGEGNAPVKEIYEALKNAGVEAPAIMEVFGGTGGIDVGAGVSYQYMDAPLFGNTPYKSLPDYAAAPYSSIIGDYASYSDLGLKGDFFPTYSSFSGILPATGAGYMNEKRGGGFSGAPSF